MSPQSNIKCPWCGDTGLLHWEHNTVKCGDCASIPYITTKPLPPSNPDGVRPARYSPLTYAAFKSEVIGGRVHTSAIPLQVVPDTLEKAVDAALTGPRAIYHKDTLVIREKDDQRTTLYIFVIRKRAPIWVRGDFGIGTKRVEDLYADLICTLDATAIWRGEEE